MSQDILLSLIDADPGQPRKHFDDSKITELAESMRSNGLIVPVMVRPVGERFIIVHGERRYRAAVSLGWATIPADVRELDSESARWFALVENIQRADLSPIEEANAYKAILDTGITQTELGKRIGKGQSYIAQKLRLLTLPDFVANDLHNGLITEGHGRQMLRLNKAPFEAYRWTYNAIIEYGLSVSATDRLIDGVFDVVSMIEAIQSGDMVSADKLLKKMPYLPDTEVPTGDLLVEVLLRAAEVAVHVALAKAPDRKLICGHDPDYEPSENDWKWIDTAVTMYLLDRQSPRPELIKTDVYYALCLREASLIDTKQGQFSLIGAHLMLGLSNMKRTWSLN